MASTDVLNTNDYALNGYLPPSQYTMAMTSSSLGYFLGQCTSQDFFKNLGNGFTQGLNFVNFVRVYPYNVMADEYTSSVAIPIGNTSVTITLDRALKRRVGTTKNKIHIVKYFTNYYGSVTRFNQCSPYVSVDCYLPFVGFVTLDMRELRESGNMIKVDLVIDVVSGNGVYSICRYDMNVKGWVVFYTTQTNFATNVAIGGTNATEQDKALFNTITQLGITAGTTALTGMALSSGLSMLGTGMAISGIQTGVSTLTSIPNAMEERVITRGTNGNFPSSINNPHAIYFIIKTKKVSDYDSFKPYYGKPLNQKKTLSSLKGITFIPNPKLEINNITKEEFDLLNQKLVDGVIL